METIRKLIQVITVVLAQTEILEMISQMETLCNESQKKRFADLFSNRPKTNKKQKL